MNEYSLYLFLNLSMLKLQIGPILFQRIPATKTGNWYHRLQSSTQIRKSDPSHTALNQAVWPLEPQKFTLNESTGTFNVLFYMEMRFFFCISRFYIFTVSFSKLKSELGLQFLAPWHNQGLHLQNLNTSGL